MTAVLLAGGSSLSQVVKTTVLLKDMKDFSEVNTIYGEYFKKDPKPARACFQAAKLPLDVMVEIECVGVVDK